MQISAWATDNHFSPDDPSQSIADHRLVGVEFTIADEQAISGQELALGFDKRGHIGRAHLLFPLKEQLEVDRQLASGSQDRFSPFEDRPHPTFIIDRPASIQFTIAAVWLKGGDSQRLSWSTGWTS